MKVTVIGGGSSYTPELINGFLERVDQFPLSELWLMDVLPERLQVVGGFAQRMVEAKGAPFSVHLTTNRREALRGASYVTTQLRVGWMQARREDEYLGLRHGLIGQETTGVGGMAKALRTIPVILGIAEDMRDLAPGALLINFTNPAGLVTEALARHAPHVPAVGVCNVPVTAKMRILDSLQIAGGENITPDRAELKTLGLNHLSWHRGFSIDGEDMWPQVMERFVDSLEEDTDEDWDLHTIQSLQMIPNYYLQYFYYTSRKLAAQEKWPPSRAEEVMVIEEKLLAQYGEA
jgi:6-phospho-beta-glucosidase